MAEAIRIWLAYALGVMHMAATPSNIVHRALGLDVGLETSDLVRKFVIAGYSPTKAKKHIATLAEQGLIYNVDGYWVRDF